MRTVAWNGLRGKMVPVNVGNYAGGVIFAHRDNVEKHIVAGGLRDWVKDICSGSSSRSTSNVSVARLIEDSF